MPTYYQKHKTIQAVQFDGTWATLLYQWPLEMWLNLFNSLQHGYLPYEFEQSNGCLKAVWPTLRTDLSWQPDAYRTKNRHYRRYQKRHVLMRNALIEPRSKPQSYKYTQTNQKLYYGDYLVIKWVHHPIKDATHHHKSNLDGYQLQIWPQAEFESQWSKTPLKPWQRSH